MEKEPNFNNSGTASDLEQFPSFEEHMAKMQQGDGERTSSKESETNVEIEGTPEERQVEDLEVLFSFCDEKDILEILKSDSYGILLKNGVSLVDLFNANALFNEQYYGDGYTKNFELRSHYDDYNKLRYFIDNRDYNVHDSHGYITYLEKQGDYEEADKVREGLSGPLKADKIRATEAKQTIAEIATIYFSEGEAMEGAAHFMDALKSRAGGGELSEEQKEFLSNEHNAVADRLLYGGKVINEKRASDILRTLNQIEDTYQKDLSSGDDSDIRNAQNKFVSNFIYAGVSIGDYLEAGKTELVSDAIDKLRELVDEHFDEVAGFEPGRFSDDYDHRAYEQLILKYSNPFKLVQRVYEYGLTGEYWTAIENPDSVIDVVAEAYRDYGTNPIYYITENAAKLKEIGVSDEAILRNCSELRPVDFVDAKSHFDGNGARLVEAGIDRKKIIKEVFSSAGQNVRPFDKNGYPYRDESHVDVLERNGFAITDIAKTFAPDAIAKNLAGFIERGADAKEITKYMLGYREEFEENIIRDAKGEISGRRYMNFDGIQTMVVWDENHARGRIVRKQAMSGSGVDFVAVNLGILAENGATEEDIINEVSGDNLKPFGFLIPKMIECQKFDTQKVLNLAYAKYVEYLKAERERGFLSERYIDMEANPNNYYSQIINQMSDYYKSIRDNYYQSLFIE